MINEFPMPRFLAERRAARIKLLNPKLDVRVVGTSNNCYVEVVTTHLSGRHIGRKVPSEYTERRGLRQGRHTR